MNRCINVHYWHKKLRVLTRNKNAVRIAAVCVAALFLGFLGTVNTKVKKATSTRTFERYLGRAPHAVVMFYEKDRKALRDDSKMRRKIDRLEDMFHGVSERYRYKEGDLVFIKVNITSEKMRTVAHDYGVNAFPTFMLFKYGSKLNAGQMMIGMASGELSGRRLEKFIESNLKESIDKIIQDKEDERERRLEEAKIRSYYRPYWGWGFGWGGPYHYWHRPYWGWGWYW